MTRVPTATYRLQFNASFGFRDATAIVPYLDALGVSDVYASSFLKAVPGSMHGYDVTDPDALNPELGAEEDYGALVDALIARDMGQVLDIIANHMGITRSENRWWIDVLENGPASRYAPFFDIDWRPLKPELEEKVLLPILGDTYGSALEAEQLQVRYADGTFRLHYYDDWLPLAPRSYVMILAHGLEDLARELGPDNRHLQELESIVTSLRNLPPRGARAFEAIVERAREQEVAKRRLGALTAAAPRIRRFVEEAVAELNGTPGDPASFDALDALLNEQAYRLAYWRVAAEEINYRRFFDINELAAIRIEHGGVFEAVHRKVFELIRRGGVTGVRIDHVDGLYDPGAYLRRWQDWARHELGEDLYLIVEKILAPDEPLPADWPVAGTTGYEFGAIVGGLFVDGRHERAFDDLYARFIQERIDYQELVYNKKMLIMRLSMPAEINLLAHQLNRFSERNRHYRDFTLNSLRNAIREIIACFPVYRTYVTASPDPPSAPDAAYITQAAARARRRNPATSALVFAFVRDLLLKQADYIPAHERDEHLRFIMRFQQTTSPVTAKGIEDTALYIYNRLVSLNEVGAAPDLFGSSPAAAHRWLAERRARTPHALSATSTHDTKRSEDVRARISALSEMPGAWRGAIARWSRANRGHRTEVDGVSAPDRNEEYLLYQTLVGTWPFGELNELDLEEYRRRIEAYMMKALKEAKFRTSWVNPDEAWEQAVRGFVAAILDPARSGRFLRDLSTFTRRAAQYGIYNSLSQLLIKIAAPGVPDFYQGTELWDFSLVDPDNRRPVDFRVREQMLGSLLGAVEAEGPARFARELVASRVDGRIKLWVTAAGLRVRRARRALFDEGEYVPCDAHGRQREHVFAFARCRGEAAVIAVVPRLVASLVDPDTPPCGAGVWGDTAIELPADAPCCYRDAFTGAVVRVEPGTSRIRVAAALESFPVALLEGDGL